MNTKWLKPKQSKGNIYTENYNKVKWETLNRKMSQKMQDHDSRESTA